MEINLILEPAPVPVITPSTLSSPSVPVSLPSVQPLLAPKPVKPQATTVPKPIFTSATPSKITPAKLQPAERPAPHKASPAKEPSSAAMGAIQAQPDDLHNDPPEYPEESRIAREQGVVVLRVEVTATGEPAKISLLKSSGFFRLDQAARRAVQLWKFHPATTAGLPVASEADVPVHFKLQ